MPNTNANPPHGIFDLATSRTLPWTEGLLLGLVLLAAGLLIALFIRRRRKAKAKKALVPRDPWSQLRNRLAPQLDQTPRERMGVLNQSLRGALELRTRRPFTSWTSREIIKEMQRNPDFSSDFQAQCAEFLMAADDILFAEAAPLAREAHERFEMQVSLWLDSLQFGRPL